jgi:hypothetical protein
MEGFALYGASVCPIARYQPRGVEPDGTAEDEDEKHKEAVSEEH